MGNSPAGARLGGDPSSDGPAAVPAAPRVLEIGLKNQLGPPLTLVQETFSKQPGAMVEIPQSITSWGKLRICGPTLSGHVVYTSSLEYSPAAVAELKLDPRLQKSKATDLRSRRAEQYFAVAACCSEGGWISSEALRLGAAHGKFESFEQCASQAAESQTPNPDGQNGLCSWQVGRLQGGCCFSCLVELRKPEAPRSALLDSLATSSASMPAPGAVGSAAVADRCCAALGSQQAPQHAPPISAALETKSTSREVPAPAVVSALLCATVLSKQKSAAQLDAGADAMAQSVQVPAPAVELTQGAAQKEAGADVVAQSAQAPRPDGVDTTNVLEAPGWHTPPAPATPQSTHTPEPAMAPASPTEAARASVAAQPLASQPQASQSSSEFQPPSRGGNAEQPTAATSFQHPPVCQPLDNQAVQESKLPQMPQPAQTPKQPSRETESPTTQMPPGSQAPKMHSQSQQPPAREAASKATQALAPPQVQQSTQASSSPPKALPQEGLAPSRPEAPEVAEANIAPPPKAARKPSSRTAALALHAAAAAEEAHQRRQQEAKQRQEEEQAAALAKQEERQEELMLRHTQDQEFHQGLLMDQMKDLMAREKALQVEQQELITEREDAESMQHRASQRLERFGENPRLAEEAAKGDERAKVARARLAEVETELSEVQQEIGHRNEVLAAMLVGDD